MSSCHHVNRPPLDCVNHIDLIDSPETRHNIIKIN